MSLSSTIPASTPIMNGTHPKPSVPDRLFSLSSPPSLPDLQKLTSQTTSSSTYPLAASINSNIPIYDLSQYSSIDATLTNTLQNEWHHILLSGPGVLILQNFLPNPDLITTVNKVYSSIISSEQSTGRKGDHFAAANSNTRIWNSLQKHALTHPSSFTTYYSNSWLSLISESYLGPSYHLTAQVNIVHPSGKPQFCHRDYHLGFQTNASVAQFPKAMHLASSLLTLQGAIAHSDMPLISGPTRFLPFSQLYEPGFLAYRLPEFSTFFEEHCVSLPLKMGDAVFFNPALFHAAGENKSEGIERSANLLQISCAFGRTMETIDTERIIGACWGDVVKMHEADVAAGASGLEGLQTGGDGQRQSQSHSARTEAQGRAESKAAINGHAAETSTQQAHNHTASKGHGADGISQRVHSAIKAIASGYPFPTNLDRRPPAPGGMAPESEQELLLRALRERWSVSEALEGIRQLRRDERA